MKYNIVNAYINFVKFYTGRKSSVLTNYNCGIVNKHAPKLECIPRDKQKDLLNYEEYFDVP